MNLFLNRLAASLCLLFAFSSTAQARWSAPTYKVADPDYSAQDPLSPPKSVNSNKTSKGTVETTFSWVPDVPGDTPPPDVYVLEQGYADWTIYPSVLAPQGMSRPSIQDASFSSRRKARLYLAQIQNGTGTADDGLGDAQVLGPRSLSGQQTGTCKGYKIVLCHPGTDGKLTVPGVTLSSSVTGAQLYQTVWSYSCQVMTLQMTRNSVDITNPNKPEVPVMVGERNQMGVSISPVPQDVAPPTFNWTLPTDGTIKDFIETTGNSNAVPPTPFTGKKVEMPSADLQTQSPHFYWYNGTFAGDSKDISVDVTLDGKTITIKGKCKVYRPKFNSFTATYTKERPQSYYLGGVRFGNPGITFNAAVQTPNVAVAAGSIAFEQKTTFNYAVQGHLNGTSYSQTRSASDALDSVDADPRYDVSSVRIAAGSTSTTTDSDSPSISPVTTDETMQASGSFKTYLVYKPGGDGSIWVVLGKLDWSFAFSASYYKSGNPAIMPTWVATTTSPTDTTTNPVGSDTYDLPEWSMRAQDAKWTQVTP